MDAWIGTIGQNLQRIGNTDSRFLGMPSKSIHNSLENRKTESGIFGDPRRCGRLTDSGFLGADMKSLKSSSLLTGPNVDGDRTGTGVEESHHLQPPPHPTSADPPRGTVASARRRAASAASRHVLPAAAVGRAAARRCSGPRARGARARPGRRPTAPWPAADSCLAEAASRIACHRLYPWA